MVTFSLNGFNPSSYKAYTLASTDPRVDCTLGIGSVERDAEHCSIHAPSRMSTFRKRSLPNFIGAERDFRFL